MQLTEDSDTNNVKLNCGLIMPISAYGAYPAEFWKKIQTILNDAICEAGMTPHPVWEDESSDIIHAKIVKNIAELPIVIGVIIGHNPNVMLECGMRLWTSLPILLIYGEGESIPFDVQSISCLKFPVQFDYFAVNEIKQQISERLRQLMRQDYKAFKSYYSLPADVEEIKGEEKIDFSQFVSEVRGGLNVLGKEMREYKRIVEEYISDSSMARNSFYRGALTEWYPPFYQAGGVGAIGPTGDADEILMSKMAASVKRNPLSASMGSMDNENVMNNKNCSK